jgi:hypothetical protein
MFEKRSQPGAPLRNRTVDLLLTMDHCAVLQPQVDRLTCANTSTRWHSQALDEPTRAPFATQSATHFDLCREPSCEVVDIWFYDQAVRVHGLSPRLTFASRLGSARCAGLGEHARRRRSWTGCTQTEPRRSLWKLITPMPDGERPRGAIVSTQPLISPGSSPDSGPIAISGCATPRRERRTSLARPRWHPAEAYGKCAAALRQAIRGRAGLTLGPSGRTRSAV